MLEFCHLHLKSIRNPVEVSNKSENRSWVLTHYCRVADQVHCMRSFCSVASTKRLREICVKHLIANPGWSGRLNFWRIQQSLFHCGVRYFALRRQNFTGTGGTNRIRCIVGADGVEINGFRPFDHFMPGATSYSSTTCRLFNLKLNTVIYIEILLQFKSFVMDHLLL